MEPLINYLRVTVLLILLAVKLVHGQQQQVTSSCTTSVMSSFTPCANIITGSTNNGLAPSSTCCDSLRSMMSTNMGCACQVMSGSTSFFQQPFTQILALSLSQACGIPAQCKASGSPNLPAAPGPAVIGSDSPSLPPSAASPLSPQVSKTVVEADDAYKYEKLQLAEEEAVAPAMEAESPTQSTPGGRIRPVLTPLSSASPHVPNLSPFAAVFILLHAFLWHPSINLLMYNSM